MNDIEIFFAIIIAYVLTHSLLIMIGGVYNRVNKSGMYDDGTMPTVLSAVIAFLSIIVTSNNGVVDTGADGNLTGWSFGFLVCGVINIAADMLCRRGTWYTCGKDER